MIESVELISLSELIEQIKADLMLGASAEGARDPLFFVEGVEVTAQVVARREKGEGGKAGLSLSVLGFKADAGVDSKTTVGNQLTQTVSIKLTPLLSKEEYLRRLTPEQQARMEETAAKAVVRGGGGSSKEIA